MRYKFIYFCLLICGLQGTIHGGAHYEAVFFIENRTKENIVVVFEKIGLSGYQLFFPSDDGTAVLFSFRGGVNASDKHFRTIRRGKLYEIGGCKYDNEDFHEKTPEEKYSTLFKFILIFKDNGDLLCRIDDFSKFKIEDRTKTRQWTYVLIIE